MPTHAEQKEVPYTPEQMFDLVAAVDKYPEFLPWCLASRITHREGDVFHADLVIGFKVFREKFSSRVTALKPDHIHVEYLSGPMKHLSNHWRFIRNNDDSCTIDFYVDFEFKNKVLQGFIEAFFNQAVKKMVNAFEKQAHNVYSSSSPLK